MSHDRSETRDVAAAHPDITARMARQYEDWTARAFVDTWPNKVPGGVVKGRLEGGGPGARRGNAGGNRRGQRRAGAGEEPGSDE